LARVLAVNNHSATGRFERLKKCLTENGAEVPSIAWVGTAASQSNEFDGDALGCADGMMPGDEIVQRLPVGSQLLPMSETSPVVAMKQETRPRYGVQFRPEPISLDNFARNRVMGNLVKLPR
jgi:GMP synthase-like glutamine amidotransferase